MASIITVSGSHGSMRVHRTSGHIVEYRHDDEAEPEYADILWFDPARLPNEDCDILETAFASPRGVYVRELSWWADTQMWEEPALLPAP